jgi:hypothetical protein
VATIRVKRGTTKPTTSNLSQIGELGFDYSNNILYARNASAVIKIGGEMELVYSYQGSTYVHTLTYSFSNNFVYRILIIAATSGSTADTASSYISYKNSSGTNLLGSQLSIYSSDAVTTVSKASGRNTSVFSIYDAYSNSVFPSIGVTKVIDFELSPTFSSSYSLTSQWVAYGKSITTASGQADTPITLADFTHSIYGTVAGMYINPGLDIGPYDSFAVSIYRTRRN